MRADSTSFPAAALQLGLVIVVAVLMLLVAGGFVASLVAGAGGGAVDVQTGSYTTVDDGVTEIPSYLDVSATRGNAAAFGPGAGSIDGPNASVDDTWSTCAVAELDDAANQQATYDVTGWDNATIQLEYANGSWSIWAQNASGATARATVAASSPTNPTAVCGVSDGSSVTIYADGSQGTTDAYDAAVESRAVSLDWYGTIDEARLFDSTLSASAASRYATDPWAPFPGEDRTSRYYLDEGQGTDTRVVFQSPNATLVGDVGWGDGVDDPQLQNGTDYEIGVGPLEIKPLAGGQVDGAPILYVEYSTNAFGAIVLSIADLGETAFVLLIVALLAIPVVAIVVVVRSTGLLGGPLTR